MKSWVDVLPRALRRVGFAFLTVLVLGVAGESGSTAWSATAPRPTSPRLYVLDCGTISPMDPGLFNLKASEVKGDVSFVSPCFLVVHPKAPLSGMSARCRTRTFPMTVLKSFSRVF